MRKQNESEYLPKPIPSLIVRLPAAWASALINNEISGMSASELTSMEEWKLLNNDLKVVDYGVDVYFGNYNGTCGDCLDFTCEVITPGSNPVA